jgi:hypothetical protein
MASSGGGAVFIAQSRAVILLAERDEAEEYSVGWDVGFVDEV